MQGFDLKLLKGVIELRAQGNRKAGTEHGPARAFASIAATIDSKLILYDVRDANYQLSELQMEERARFIARLFNGYRIAYVLRVEQLEFGRLICRAHHRNGDQAKTFSSKSAATGWLTG